MKTINKIIIVLLAVFMSSCEDILEKDISNSSVQATYPLNGAVIQSNVVNFQWNKMDGAKTYRVQVFDMNQSLIAEKESEDTHLEQELPSGHYQWRVRAENFAYQSQYTFPIAFSTEISEDLTNQSVILSSPDIDAYTNLTALTLSWQSLQAATHYVVEVINTTTGQSVYSNTNQTTTIVQLNNVALSAEGVYQWKVQAVNSDNDTQTQYSTRKFSIDRVNPNQPQNVAPANNATLTVNQQITFSWTIPQDSGTVQSPISYVLQFSDNVNFTNVTQQFDVSGTSLQQTFTNPGTYYWRVKAKDKAGNEGVYSGGYKFVLN
ncbi:MULTISPECIES: hypothetical protein [Flavobacterium]|uniref:hypothetical protein n=1 Tax=Flavobacterium TaxID=237 RepID=UPI0015A95D6C|nr:MULTISPECIES: hypothetical protein [Flavobacterium]